MKRKNGITLIALVVTIVVLLILAGISISVLSGDNGIINQAKKGKEETEIAEEKEIIDTSAAQAANADVMGNLEKNKLQDKLNSNAGNGVTEVMDNGDTLVVKFIEKNRYYEIDKDGKTEGPKVLIKDDNAGDISKGGIADGSEDNPFQINCIEDLVEFSIMVNGGNEELGITSNRFYNEYIELMRTLDFKSIFSYGDYTTTKYGDLNTDGIVEDIKTELTKTSEGCIGFTPIGHETFYCEFAGTFDGKNFKINNLYENTKENAGLFGDVNTATIMNIEITGKIISTENMAGGIVGKTHGKATIVNTGNYANIVSNDNAAGGIIGYTNYADIEIYNCYNYGKIDGMDSGGIVGNAYGTTGGNVKIYNCFNAGEINGNSSGGILGSAQDGRGSPTYIYNCFNVGHIYGMTFGSIGGDCHGQYIKNIQNCYYLDNVEQSFGKITNFNDTIIKVSNNYICSKEFLQNLNSYVENYNSQNIESTELKIFKIWKTGEDGYPTFK